MKMLSLSITMRVIEGTLCQIMQRLLSV